MAGLVLHEDIFFQSVSYSTVIMQVANNGKQPKSNHSCGNVKNYSLC